MNPIPVTCAIIVKDGKVLAVQRSATMSLPLKWEFPGGKVIPGESEENCLKREIREELNIDISIAGKLGASVYDYGKFCIRLIPFLANYIGGDIILHEHSQMGWYDKEGLMALDWAAADLQILQELMERYEGFI
jgi:8-oxo-dGTP diphosphatase